MKDGEILAESLDYYSVVDKIDTPDVTQANASTEVNVTALFQNRVSLRKIRYSDLGSLLEFAEVKKAEVQEAAQQRQAQQKAAAAPQTYRPQLQKETENASAKLKQMVGGSGKEYEQNVTKPVESVSAEKLIMPKLSLHDQVADLEKIEQGLEENAFDKDEIEIITQEISWLVQTQAKEGKKKLDKETQALVTMRNKKVKEIKDELKQVA